MGNWNMSMTNYRYRLRANPFSYPPRITFYLLRETVRHFTWRPWRWAQEHDTCRDLLSAWHLALLSLSRPIVVELIEKELCRLRVSLECYQEISKASSKKNGYVVLDADTGDDCFNKAFNPYNLLSTLRSIPTNTGIRDRQIRTDYVIALVNKRAKHYG